MGIEPTDHTVYVWPDGFEGRAEHQLKKHFRCYLPILIVVQKVVYRHLDANHTDNQRGSVNRPTNRTAPLDR